MAVKRIVLVTGLMRSGTSAVAGMLHAMGVPMAVKLLAPVAPTFRLEWEDAEAALMLTSWAVAGRPRPKQMAQRFGGYLSERVRQIEETDRARGMETEAIGFKSPLLALLWTDLQAEGFGPALPATWIVTDRAGAEVQRSFDNAFPEGSELRRTWVPIQERIEDELFQRSPALRVPYGGLVGYPRGWAKLIAGAVGVTDEVRIAAAAATVQEPTSCPR